MAAERVLPHSLDAEKSVLGAPMAGDVALFDIAAGVIRSPRDFFREPHQEIWKAEGALRERGMAIDYLTVIEELRVMDKLEFVGGPAYVSALTDGIARAENVEHYATIVRGKAVLRELIFASNKIQAAAYLAEEEPDEVLDLAERVVMEVGAHAVTGDFVLADEWMRETHHLIAKAYEDRRIVTGIPSDIKKLDRMTRGWQGGDLIYFGAAPGSGKTAMMLQLARAAGRYFADQQIKKTAGIISLEMSRASMGLRAVAGEAHLDHFRLSTGHISEWELKLAGDALNALSSYNIAIDDSTGTTATQLRAKARRFALRYGLGVLFIDYAQLMQDGEKAENRNLELGKISWGWKALARELNIPVFILSQLAGAPVKENKRPRPSDMRDSGTLHQDADVVLLLWRPQQSSDDTQAGEEAELIIGKQRNGPLGPIRLNWIGEQMRFESLEEQPQEPSKQGSLV